MSAILSITQEHVLKGKEESTKEHSSTSNCRQQEKVLELKERELAVAEKEKMLCLKEKELRRRERAIEKREELLRIRETQLPAGTAVYTF